MLQCWGGRACLWLARWQQIADGHGGSLLLVSCVLLTFSTVPQR